MFTALLSGPSPIDSWFMFSNDKKHLKQGVSFIQQLENYLTTPITTIKKDFLCSIIVDLIRMAIFLQLQLIMLLLTTARVYYFLEIT